MSSPSRFISARRIRHTLTTLVFASAVCVLMWCVRAYVAHGFRFAGFVFNLFLAWIPLLLALVIRRQAARTGLVFCLLGLAWFLFFPNAFYILTDLIHFKKFGTDGV